MSIVASSLFHLTQSLTSLPKFTCFSTQLIDNHGFMTGNNLEVIWTGYSMSFPGANQLWVNFTEKQVVKFAIQKFSSTPLFKLNSHGSWRQFLKQLVYDSSTMDLGQIQLLISWFGQMPVLLLPSPSFMDLKALSIHYNHLLQTSKLTYSSLSLSPFSWLFTMQLLIFQNHPATFCCSQTALTPFVSSTVFQLLNLCITVSSLVLLRLFSDLTLIYMYDTLKGNSIFEPTFFLVFSLMTLPMNSLINMSAYLIPHMISCQHDGGCNFEHIGQAFLSHAECLPSNVVGCFGQSCTTSTNQCHWNQYCEGICNWCTRLYQFLFIIFSTINPNSSIVFASPVQSGFLPPKWATVNHNQSRTNPDIVGTEPDHLGPVFCGPWNWFRPIQTGFFV